MSALTNVAEEAIGNHLLRTASFPKPAALFLGLLREVTNADAQTFVEPSGGAYARIAAGPSDAMWTPPAGGNKRFSNAAPFTFPAPTADWHSGSNAITHFGLFDAASGGVALIIAPLTNARFIYGNDPAPLFDTGALRIPFVGHATDYLVGQIGNHILRDGLWDKPAALNIGLAVGSTEVSGGGYTRRPAGPGDSHWSAPVSGNGVFENLQVISWSSPGANWGSVSNTHFYDAASGGNLLLEVPTGPVTINTGALAPNFQPGRLRVTVA
jgi:hypothetical protein